MHRNLSKALLEVSLPSNTFIPMSWECMLLKRKSQEEMSMFLEDMLLEDKDYRLIPQNNCHSNFSTHFICKLKTTILSPSWQSPRLVCNFGSYKGKYFHKLCFTNPLHCPPGAMNFNVKLSKDDLSAFKLFPEGQLNYFPHLVSLLTWDLPKFPFYWTGFLLLFSFQKFASISVVSCMMMTPRPPADISMF